MNRCSQLLALITCIVLAVQAVAEETSHTIQTRIQLLPRTDDSRGHMHEYLLRGLKDKVLAETAGIKVFPRWRVYEDENIKFSYPDNQHIKVEVKTPKDRIPIMGGPVGTTENTFFRCYRLMVGEHTYALLLLDNADAFDDGICLCGAVVYQKYMFHNGSLCRFDFLEDGNIKKVQMLRKGVRVVMFEWTHLPMAQDVYVNLALGITLKSEPCDQGVMRKAVLDKYGFAGRLGFLEKGMTLEEVITLLGQPTDATEEVLTYVQKEGRWQTTTTIHLKHSVFNGFTGDWRDRVKLPAKHGSVDWIAETVEGNQTDMFADDSERKPLSSKTIQYIFDRFVETGPTVQSNDWSRLCQAINKLREMGHTDKRIIPILRKRFEDISLCQHHAAWLLHEYDPEGSRSLFAKRIRLTLDGAHKIAMSGEEEEYSLILGPFDDLHNLLCFLGKSHPKRSSFIVEAMDHPHPDIRSAAYFFWDCIPDKDAHPRLTRGITDKDVSVRQWSSWAYAKSFGSRDDLPLLKERILTEKDEETSQNLKTAIERLEKKIQKPNKAIDGDER